MQKHLFLSLRILLLLLSIPLLGIAFAPASKINADCNPNNPLNAGSIHVSNGLVSSSNLTVINNLTPQGSGVNCVTGQAASIPQFSIQSYDEMKKLYFDQAKNTYNKITITPAPPQTNVTQTSDSFPVNFKTISN